MLLQNTGILTIFYHNSLGTLNQQNISSDNRSISSRTQSNEDSLSLGLDMAIRKKFGKSPSGWYANIMFPFKVIDSLIFGATLLKILIRSVWLRFWLKSCGGSYQKLTLGPSISFVTSVKLSRSLTFSSRYRERWNILLIESSNPLSPLDLHISHSLNTSLCRPHCMDLSPVSYVTS